MSIGFRMLSSFAYDQGISVGYSKKNEDLAFHSTPYVSNLKQNGVRSRDGLLEKENCNSVLVIIYQITFIIAI